MRNQEGKTTLQKTVYKRKMIYHFKLNIYMSLLSNIPHFLPLLITWWYDFNTLYLIIISAMKFAHTEYIFNEKIYRIKCFTILESQFIGNLELYWTKKHSSFNLKYYRWYFRQEHLEWTIKKIFILTGLHL